jgi:hypothetical protein
MAKSINVIQGAGHGTFESLTDFDNYVSVILDLLSADDE